MLKTLDFNSLEKPVLELTLKDVDRTVVRLTAPSEELVGKLTSASGELQNVLKDDTGVMIKALFELIAQLMSCNLDGLRFTAEDLRDKYGMKLYEATVFVRVYLDFIKDLTSAKN